MINFSEKVKRLAGIKSGRITKKWAYDSEQSLLAAPAVADINNDGSPEIIFGTKKGEIIVIDENAKEHWRFKVQDDMESVESMFLDQEVMNSINAPPTITDLYNDGKQKIIFGSEKGKIYCLDDQGKPIWDYDTKSGIRGGILVEDINNDGKKEIVFGATDGYLYLLSDKGKLIEKFKQESPLESTPGFYKGQIIFGTNNGEIISMTPEGEKKWSYKTEAKVTAEPAFSQLTRSPIDFVIIGSTDNKLYCLDTEGELVWTYETRGAIYSKAAIADINNDGKKEIIIGSCDNNVYAINSDGEKLWSFETDFWVVSTPLIADVDGDGKLEVIAGSYDHNIYVLDNEGSYLLDYVPGISGVVEQTGHYAEIMTQEPGEHVGKKLWQFKTEGVIVGCAQLSDGKSIVVATKTGKVDNIEHQH